MWSFRSKIHCAETNLSKRFVDKRIDSRTAFCLLQSFHFLYYFVNVKENRKSTTPDT